MKHLIKFVKYHKEDLILGLIFLLGFILSYVFLMHKTFQLDSDNNLMIGSKVWSDFAATIPLIRSFSYGSNFPPEYPIFAGPPIRYHFIFFFLVGMIEKIGVNLPLALNTLSALSFALLVTLIYKVSATIFKSSFVGVLSIILFLFNGSFSFVEFFKIHPLSINTFSDIIHNNTFPSFGPYDGKIVSAFWNLNIYTNQRHLSLAYSFFLIILFIVYQESKYSKKLKNKTAFILGLILGLTPFLHMSAFIMTAVSISIFFIIYKNLRIQMLIVGVTALILALPQYLYMGNPQIKTSLFHLGYLVNPLTVSNFINYWLLNLGLSSIVGILGFLMSHKDQKKLFLPFFCFFIIGNVFQFAPDIPTNHKFFNLFIIGLNFFTAFFVYKLWIGNLLRKLLAIILVLLMTISGVIDLFPILNDHLIKIEDGSTSKRVMFIRNNIPANSIVLNSDFLFDSASLAGRKIYLGWPYFSWGAGYDTSHRDKLMKEMLTPKDLFSACTLYTNEGIDYIETKDPTTYSDTFIDYDFFDKNFVKIYSDTNSNYSIYIVSSTCTTPNNVLKR